MIFFNVGIDPSGCGKTGIFIKNFNGVKRQWHATIEANNPSEAFQKILNYIEECKTTVIEDVLLKHVVVELLHDGVEKFKEIKMTRELIGILRWHFKSKFIGLYPAAKNKTEVNKLLQKHGRKAEHWIHAKAILDASFKNTFKTQNWKWVEISGS